MGYFESIVCLFPWWSIRWILSRWYDTCTENERGRSSIWAQESWRQRYSCFREAWHYDILTRQNGPVVLYPISLKISVCFFSLAKSFAQHILFHRFDISGANHTPLIIQTMREMENLTAVNNTPCIRFREKTPSDSIFITIFNGSGCYAIVGSWGNYTGLRPVSLMDSPDGTCMVPGIIQHELNHVLGRHISCMWFRTIHNWSW